MTAILIIDDDPVALRAVVAELGALGFETLIARNGIDGLRQAEQSGPDLFTKPFDPREVLARVSAHLQQRRLSARPADQGDDVPLEPGASAPET